MDFLVKSTVRNDHFLFPRRKPHRGSLNRKIRALRNYVIVLQQQREDHLPGRRAVHFLRHRLRPLQCAVEQIDRLNAFQGAQMCHRPRRAACAQHDDALSCQPDPFTHHGPVQPFHICIIPLITARRPNQRVHGADRLRQCVDLLQTADHLALIRHRHIQAGKLQGIRSLHRLPQPARLHRKRHIDQIMSHLRRQCIVDHRRQCMFHRAADQAAGPCLSAYLHLCILLHDIGSAGHPAAKLPQRSSASCMLPQVPVSSSVCYRRSQYRPLERL